MQVTFWSGDDPVVAPGSADRRWWALAALAIPLLASAFDVLGLAVLLPYLADSLDADTAEAGWILCAYVLAYALPLVALGRIVERGGRRGLCVAGTLVVLAAALASAAAQEPWQLAAGRALAGLGSALFTSAALGALRTSFADGAWRAVLTVWAAVGAVGLAAGGIIAGVVVEQVTWPMFFLVPVPLLLASAWLIAVLVPDAPPMGGGPIDRDGLVAGALGSMMVIGAVLGAAVRGPLDPLVLGTAAVGLAALVAFVRIERTGPAPLLDLRLLGDPRVARATVVTCGGDAVLGSLVPALAIWLAYARAEQPIVVGLVVASFGVPFAVAFLISEVVHADRGSRLTLVGGSGLLVVATGLIGWALVDDSMAGVTVGLVLAGLGHGIVLHLGTTEAVAATPDHAGGMAGLVGTLRWLSLVAGVALGLTVLSITYDSALLDDLRGAGHGIDGATVDALRGTFPGSPASLVAVKQAVPEALGSVNEAATRALGTGARTAAAVAVVAAVAGLAASVRLRSPQPLAREAVTAEGG